MERKGVDGNETIDRDQRELEGKRIEEIRHWQGIEEGRLGGKTGTASGGDQECRFGYDYIPCHCASPVCSCPTSASCLLCPSSDRSILLPSLDDRSCPTVPSLLGTPRPAVLGLVPIRQQPLHSQINHNYSVLGNNVKINNTYDALSSLLGTSSHRIQYGVHQNHCYSTTNACLRPHARWTSGGRQ